MAWELPGSAPGSLPSRWTALGTALDQFVALWQQASESDVTGDRLGLVHFDTDDHPAAFPGIFKTRGDWVAFVTAAKAPTPGGWTAIGKGLNQAISSWTSNPVNFDAAIVLMTDGEQNQDPQVIPLGVGSDWALDDLSGGGPVELYKKGMPIQTIGFGTPAAVQAQLLDGIAKETAGTSIITATASGLSLGMQDVLISALKGNSLGLLARREESVKPTSPFGSPVKLQLDSSVSRATFVLSWEGRRGLFELLLQPPGGSTPIQPTVRRDGANWLVASVDIPASGPRGEWTVLVHGRDMSTPATYQLSAYAVDTRLKYSLLAEPRRVGTGDPLRIAAELSYEGKPLTGIPGGIRINLDRPAEGLGNILHETIASPAIPSGPDPASPYTAKVLSLARAGTLLPRISPQPTGTPVTLTDDGANGDASANDGVYTATIADTHVPGRYRFNVVLEWNDPRTGKVSRVEAVEREVQVVPDPKNSEVTIVAGPTAGTFQVLTTPRDRFGNYMGPGYDNRVKLVLTGGGNVSGMPADSQQTGVYVVSITGVPTGVTPKADIKVNGVNVRTAMPVVPGKSSGGGGGICGRLKLSQGGGLGTGFIIAGIVVYWRRRKKNA
jgi:hypothetical protein